MWLDISVSVRGTDFTKDVVYVEVSGDCVGTVWWNDQTMWNYEDRDGISASHVDSMWQAVEILTGVRL